MITVGVDDAGRGALAGPLVIAATAFDDTVPPVKVSWWTGSKHKDIFVGDSKKITPSYYTALSTEIHRQARACVVIHGSVDEINSRGIDWVYRYVMGLAAHRVIESIRVSGNTDTIDLVFDGHIRMLPEFAHLRHRAVPKADATVWQVGAASILAKKSQLEVMEQLDQQYPNYMFGVHHGYATDLHRALLKKYGACPCHRVNYTPVRDARI